MARHLPTGLAITYYDISHCDITPNTIAIALTEIISQMQSHTPSDHPAHAHSATHSKTTAADRLRDFTTDRRLLILVAMALVVGTVGALAAWALLHLIYLATNLAYHGKFTDAPAIISDTVLSPLSVLVPVAGCFVVGLMARYGSEKIRGHGIPEAMEAILIGGSRIERPRSR